MASRVEFSSCCPQPTTISSKRARNRSTSILLFTALFVVYLANAAYLVTGDAASIVYTTVSLIHDGDFKFDPFEAPMIFDWKIESGGRSATVVVTGIDERIAELIDSGRLSVERHNLSIATPAAMPGWYISAFPPGSSLLALPVYALVESWAGDLRRHPALLWYTGKVFGAACTAGAAVAIFWTVLGFADFAVALACSMIYGLASAAWTTASQGLFQHGPNELFLSLGMMFLLWSERKSRFAAWSGLSLAVATSCRPTSAIVVVAFGLYLALRDRRRLLAFAVGGVPVVVLFAAYNYTYLGSPLRLGQATLGELAEQKTGSPDIFSTPVLYGLAGLLWSPSRGLFVFSPVFLFSVAGAAVVLRDRSLAVLRPAVWAIAIVLIVEAKHFDWWSGWAYGYRHLADTTPFLSMLLAPVLPGVWKRSLPRAAFLLTVLVSIAVQALGAFTYDGVGWNQREGFEVVGGPNNPPRWTLDRRQAERWASESQSEIRSVPCDIDNPRFRNRVWSISDNEIVYYATRPALSRRGQRKMSDFFVQPLDRQRKANYARIAAGFAAIGDVDSALKWREYARE